MLNYILISITAFILSFSATPIARKLGLQIGIISRPSSSRWGIKPVSLLGGLAIYSGLFLALLIFGEKFKFNQIVGIFLGATIVSFLGLWDDMVSLKPLSKIIGQMLATLILIYNQIQIELFCWNFLNIFLTIFWIIGITNAMNLLDNMDGLAGGIGAIAAFFFLVTATLNGQYLVGSLSAALLGACLGFLYYNYNPATIFMGDNGSLFLGFLLAVVGIKLRFPDRPNEITWAIPIVILGVPIADTFLVMISRLRRGLNPFTTPGTDHISHRLASLGFSSKRAVGIIYITGIILGCYSLLFHCVNINFALSIILEIMFLLMLLTIIALLEKFFTN
ncbi:MAG: MraY family glycosyltransferase [Thermodesulfobacteriota bacterium]|nr:MraY family glycosyltransferase [Thermodesulfobacteriota bacterium]